MGPPLHSTGDPAFVSYSSCFSADHTQSYSSLGTPGTYTVKLTVDGKAYVQKLTVKMDPNVKTPAADLALQHDLSFDLYMARKNLLSKKPATENEKKESAQLDRKMAAVFEILQDTDMPPTTQAVGAAKELINRKE